jgi:putative PEP-CTERM system TPR-repeat lipoprotein
MIRSALKLVVLSLLLIGCNKQTTEELLAKAESYIANEKLNDAEIVLKNAIKEYPRNAQLRETLGNLYLSQGLGAIAEKELGRAIELGFTSDKTSLNFLKALNMQHKVEDVLTFVDNQLTPSEAMIPALKTYAGIAFNEQNYPSKAKRSFEQALMAQTSNKFTKLSSAYLAFYDNDLNKTITILNDALREEPNFAEALSFKGIILYYQKRFSESADTLQVYLEAYPNAHWIRIYYAQSLVRADLFQEADKEIRRLLVLFPNQPLLNSLKAAVEFEAENYLLAKEHAERALQYGDKEDSTIFIAGVSAMRLENFEQAYSYLENLVSKLPAQHPIHKLFSIVQFKVGYFQDAAESLETLGAQNQEDFELYSSMSYGMLKAGRVLEAKELISKAESMLDGTPEALSRIGQLKLSINDMSGIDDLIESLKNKPDQTHTKLMLVTAYLQSGEFEKSLEIAKSWQTSEPDNVEPINLEAFIYYKKGELDKAEAIYGESLKTEPANFRAHLFIKNRLVNRGLLEQAATQMESFLQYQPTDLKALIQLYLVRKQQGNTKGVISRIEKEFNTAPNEQLKIVLAKVYNAERMYTKAVSLLMPKDAATGYPTFYWQTLVESLLNLDDDEKTKNIISRWQISYPSSIPAIFYKIILLERQGKLYEALEVLAKWNNTRNHNQLLVKEALLNIKVNRFPQAIANLNRISDNSLDTPAGRYILGRVAVWSKNHLEAKKLLMESYQAIPIDDTAAWLSEQIKEVDGENQAIQFLEAHLTNSPSDVLARTQLANILSNIDNRKAAEQYKIVLNYAPKNVIALNNLAWDAKQNGNLTLAESYADQAIEYANNIPDILDTIAIIKLELGKTQKANELLERAHKLDVTNSKIAIHYSDVLNKLGQKQKALDVLQRVLPSNEEQELQVSELLRSLKN